MTCAILWEFEVAEANRAAFARAYDGAGPFAALFGEGDGFLGTTLLANKERPGVYVTIDRWTNREAYASFKLAFAERYEALDDEYAGLSKAETYIGSFDEVGG